MDTPDPPFLPRAADKLALTRRAGVRVRLTRTADVARRQLDDIYSLDRERGIPCRLWRAKDHLLAPDSTIQRDIGNTEKTGKKNRSSRDIRCARLRPRYRTREAA